MSNEYPQFSVLMSLYHAENPSHLDDCLNSLFYQTVKADEIIIVLDGDVTTELHSVLDKWKILLPIKLLPLEINVGLGNALNHGLKYCKHNLVARMDTDDICCPHRFKKQLDYFKLNTKTVALGTAITEFTKKIGDGINIRYSTTGASDIREYSKKRNPLNHMSVMFKKEYISMVGGYHHHMYMEDYNLWLRLLAAGLEVDNLEESLVYARVGNGMLERRKGLAYITSEYYLYCLKKKLNIDNGFHAFIIFCLRAIPRLLPMYLLSKIYLILRK